MSTTSFDGPVKAGDILNTIGTTLSDDVSNVGFATMGQVYECDGASADPSWTDIVIPANSQITRMAILVTDPFGPSGEFDVGRSDSVSSSQSYFVNNLPTTDLGLIEATTHAQNLDAWKDTGSLDIHLTYHWTITATASAMLIVEYIQNNNLTA